MKPWEACVAVALAILLFAICFGPVMIMMWKDALGGCK